MRTKLRVVEEDGVALEDAAEGGRLDLAVASLVVQRKRVPQLHGKTGIVSTAWQRARGQMQEGNPFGRLDLTVSVYLDLERSTDSIQDCCHPKI